MSPSFQGQNDGSLRHYWAIRYGWARCHLRCAIKSFVSWSWADKLSRSTTTFVRAVLNDSSLPMHTFEILWLMKTSRWLHDDGSLSKITSLIAVVFSAAIELLWYIQKDFVWCYLVLNWWVGWARWFQVEDNVVVEEKVSLLQKTAYLFKYTTRNSTSVLFGQTSRLASCNMCCFYVKRERMRVSESGRTSSLYSTSLSSFLSCPNGAHYLYFFFTRSSSHQRHHDTCNELRTESEHVGTTECLSVPILFPPSGLFNTAVGHKSVAQSVVCTLEPWLSLDVPRKVRIGVSTRF